jgi:hypothetical protein
MFHKCFAGTVHIHHPFSTMTFIRMTSKAFTQAAADVMDGNLKQFLEGLDTGVDGKEMMKELVCHSDNAAESFSDHHIAQI